MPNTNRVVILILCLYVVYLQDLKGGIMSRTHVE